MGSLSARSCSELPSRADHTCAVTQMCLQSTAYPQSKSGVSRSYLSKMKSGTTTSGFSTVNSANFKTYVPSSKTSVFSSGTRTAGPGGKTTRWNPVTASGAYDLESQRPARPQVIVMAPAAAKKSGCCSCCCWVIALIVIAICVVTAVAFVVLNRGAEPDKIVIVTPEIVNEVPAPGPGPVPNQKRQCPDCKKMFSKRDFIKHQKATAHKCSKCNKMIDYGVDDCCSLHMMHEANCGAPPCEWHCPNCPLVFDVKNAPHKCVHDAPSKKPSKKPYNGRIHTTTRIGCSRCGKLKCNGGCGKKPFRRPTHFYPDERLNMKNGLHPNGDKRRWSDPWW